MKKSTLATVATGLTAGLLALTGCRGGGVSIGFPSIGQGYGYQYSQPGQFYSGSCCPSQSYSGGTVYGNISTPVYGGTVVEEGTIVPSQTSPEVIQTPEPMPAQGGWRPTQPSPEPAGPTPAEPAPAELTPVEPTTPRQQNPTTRPVY